MAKVPVCGNVHNLVFVSSLYRTSTTSPEQTQKNTQHSQPSLKGVRNIEPLCNLVRNHFTSKELLLKTKN